MAYRILQVEGRVLSCQSKPNDNKRLLNNIPRGRVGYEMIDSQRGA